MQQTSSATHRLTIIQAAQAMDNCSSQTVYNRIKKFNWSQELDAQGNSYVWIPDEYLKTFKNYSKLETILGDPANPAATPASNEVQQLLEKLQESYETQLELMAQRLKDQEALAETQAQLIQTKKTVIQNLNNELEATRNKLILYRDQKKSWSSWLPWRK